MNEENKLKKRTYLLIFFAEAMISIGFVVCGIYLAKENYIIAILAYLVGLIYLGMYVELINKYKILPFYYKYFQFIKPNKIEEKK